MIPDWQRRRSGFNHDWLKNRFLTGVSSFMNMLDDQFEDAEAEERFLSETLPQWPGRAREVGGLVRDFESEMTPKTLFRRPPLSRCSPETMAWLPELVHVLWRQRVEVDQLRAVADEALVGANEAFAEVVRAMESCSQQPSVASLRPHREYFVRFRTACENLSRSFSRFPSRIEIV